LRPADARLPGFYATCYRTVDSMSTDDSARPRPATVAGPPDSLARRARDLRLRARVAALEAELERERDRRQAVIRRYERLLEARTREEVDPDDERWDGDVFSLLLD
jgi:hypothetical protein